MSWTSIARQGAGPTNATPADGVRVYRHRITRQGKEGGFIAIAIGADLARGLGFSAYRQPVRLMLGSDNDAGKIAIVADPTGPFAATANHLGKKAGRAPSYRIAINRQSAEGLFAFDFKPFTRAGLEVIKPENGKPRMATFLATGELLDINTGRADI